MNADESFESLIIFFLVFTISIFLLVSLSKIDFGNSSKDFITRKEVIQIVDSVAQKHLGNVLLEHSLEAMRYEIDSLKMEVRDIGSFTLSVVDMVYPEEESWSGYDIEGKHTDSIDYDAWQSGRTRENAMKNLETIYN
ncbi:MAG: hypothetical protein ACOC80_09620 [Petrotogales bacterium]